MWYEDPSPQDLQLKALDQKYYPEKSSELGFLWIYNPGIQNWHDFWMIGIVKYKEIWDSCAWYESVLYYWGMSVVFVGLIMAIFGNFNLIATFIISTFTFPIVAPIALYAWYYSLIFVLDLFPIALIVVGGFLLNLRVGLWKVGAGPTPTPIEFLNTTDSDIKPIIDNLKNGR